VIETERVFTVPDAAPAVEQVDAPPVVGQADPTIREWFERAERDDDETSDAEEEEEAAPAAAPASAVTRAPEAERTG